MACEKGRQKVEFVITAMSGGTGKMIALDTRYCEELCLVVELVLWYGDELVGMEMSWLVWR